MEISVALFLERNASNETRKLYFRAVKLTFTPKFLFQRNLLRKCKIEHSARILSYESRMEFLLFSETNARFSRNSVTHNNHSRENPILI